MLHPCPLFFQYFRSSSKKHDSTWSQNAESTTYTEGGDPAIKSFNSDTEWTAYGVVILLDSLSLHSFSFCSLFLLQLYITVLYSSVVFLILVVSYRIVFGMFNRKELYVVGISHILIDLVE